MLSDKMKLGILLVVVCVFFLGSCNAGKQYEGKDVKRGRTGGLNLPRAVNGGSDCAACTVLVSLSEQVAEIHNETIVQGLQRICSFLPESFQATCDTFLEIATPILIEMAFDDFITPDVACQLLNFCYTEAGQETCHLYPLPSVSIGRVVEKVRRRVPPIYGTGRRFGSDSCPDLPIIKQICEMFEGRFGDKHLPVVDVDQDNFSIFKTFRGSYWRGKDCNDLKADFHPGVRAINQDEVFDSDCNGIYGIDPQSMKPYEEVLCAHTPRMGVAVLGDSMSAHFHIPKQWFIATDLSVEVFKNVAMIGENEMDWPMTSAFTGFMNSSWSVLTGPTESFYLRLRGLNHCNHRDFQNIAVNGARVSDMNSTIQYGLSRDHHRDHPLMVIYSLVANDVCNGHNDTIDHMTTPEEVKENFLSTLKYLDTKLPSGSHVIATGLVQYGKILHDIFKNRIHPIGEWRQDVTYPDVNTFLNCLAISPCLGWLSPNESLRNYTFERAANLSKVLERESNSYKAMNFDLHYIDFSFPTVEKLWKERGGETWQLFEPVDGIHPSQVALSLFSEVYWAEIERQIPDVFKTFSNPENARIKAIFGDQGGY